MQIERDVVLANRYRVESCLGRGGMGSVWRGRDLHLDRAVAIKAATASAGSRGGAGQARRRLRREAEALAALSEPHIARVYDLVEKDRDVCLVMELVEGESLAARLRHQPRLPVGDALEIAEQCAQALHAAHRIGIVHRDVKPSNVMMGPAGVKVVDFGIAAHIGPASGDTTQTMTAELVGTAAYFAPERALGAPPAAAADFYALGVMLYQMLTGHLPFRADESLAMLYAHATATPEPLPVEVPAPVAALCLRLLSKNPADRPMSVGAIAAARDSAADPAVDWASETVHIGHRTPGLTSRMPGFGGETARRRLAAPIAAVGGTAAALLMAITLLLVGQPTSAGTATFAPAPSGSPTTNTPTPRGVPANAVAANSPAHSTSAPAKGPAQTGGHEPAKPGGKKGKGGGKGHGD